MSATDHELCPAIKISLTAQTLLMAGRGFNAGAYASRGLTTSGDLFFVEFTNVETS